MYIVLPSNEQYNYHYRTYEVSERASGKGGNPWAGTEIINAVSMSGKFLQSDHQSLLIASLILLLDLNVTLRLAPIVILSPV